MNATPPAKPTLRQLGGFKRLLANPGFVLAALRAGAPKGTDAAGNYYYEAPGRNKSPRNRRWVVYAGAADASAIGPHWHAWLHHLTDEPLPEDANKPWELPHKANQTGTAQSYRPPGHDYEGGQRARASADYEAWSPDQN